MIHPRIHKPNSFCHHDYVHAIQILLSEKDTFFHIRKNGLVCLFFLFDQDFLTLYSVICLFLVSPWLFLSVLVQGPFSEKSARINVLDFMFLEWFLAVNSENTEVTRKHHPFPSFRPQNTKDIKSLCLISVQGGRYFRQFDLLNMNHKWN